MPKDGVLVLWADGQTAFVILSFEGPDPYASAGGLAARVVGLADQLAATGAETHLVFAGDPALPGQGQILPSGVRLHRWCQWISQYHPEGVYDGEDGKVWDWERSLPPWLCREVIRQAVAAGKHVVVLAEEWHTAGSVVALGRLVDEHGWQSQVHIMWNANNTFGFHRIPWAELQRAATLTTVSRYMRQAMTAYGVDAAVVPNGLARSWFPSPKGVDDLVADRLFQNRTTLVKVARWDRDKGWEAAIEGTRELKQRGSRPVLVARGGMEPYGAELLQSVSAAGLSITHVTARLPTMSALAAGIESALGADVVVVDSRLSQAQERFLFRAATAVLANSTKEPFGLVGLETMAVGGMAVVGQTGEDYATPGYDCLAVHSDRAVEIAQAVRFIRASPARARAIRHAALGTAKRYSWDSVIRRRLAPLLHGLGVPAPALPRRRPADVAEMDRKRTP